MSKTLKSFHEFLVLLSGHYFFLMIALCNFQKSVLSFTSNCSRFGFLRRTLSNQVRGLNMSSRISGKSFISVDEAIEAYQSDMDNLKFVDGSWWLGNARNAQQEFEEGPRIAGAHFFDIDAIAAIGEDLNPKSLPHMAPPKVSQSVKKLSSLRITVGSMSLIALFDHKELFAAAMDEMGITNYNHVVIYGSDGCMFVPRTYYTFVAMGHDPEKVHLMQGSIKEWIEKGCPVETCATRAIDVSTLDTEKSAKYVAKDPTGFCGMDRVREVANTMGKGDAIVVDARSAGRFVATEPEPRPGLRGGHIPGSFNLPFVKLLQGPEGDWTKFRSNDQLRQAFEEAGIDIETDKQIICSCGSGVTAAVIATALEKCGRSRDKTTIFDGSWIEWASELTNPVNK